MTIASLPNTEAEGTDEPGALNRWDPSGCRRGLKLKRRAHHLRRRRDPNHRPGPPRAQGVGASVTIGFRHESDAGHAAGRRPDSSPRSPASA